ncbi:MAG: Aldose 1-epimerase [Rhodanobacteraceae bacterium]|nr:MAG: Aldose 1-epimerase [Rhodanobacteraceae bacterium]
MTRYTAERASVGAQPIVVLANDAGQRARIACHGAALLSLESLRNGTPFDIAWGYRNAEEIAARPGSHFAILAPFGGRVGDARYSFDGESFDLEPGVTGAAREFRHGFVRDVDFTIADLTGGATSATATLATRAIRPRPGYPFSIDLAIRFTLDAGGLTLEARMRNVGDRAAPCFFGWHAYFRAGGGMADDWMLEIPAHTTIRTDARLIPLPGEAAYVPLEQAPALDFRTARHIGTTVLDNGYAGLAIDGDGRMRTHLTDPSSGFSIGVWQERGVMHAFTGDTLGAGARSAVALEPMECMADAFNRPDYASAIRLEPGAERVFRCGVECPAPATPR